MPPALASRSPARLPELRRKRSRRHGPPSEPPSSSALPPGARDAGPTVAAPLPARREPDAWDRPRPQDTSPVDAAPTQLGAVDAEALDAARRAAVSLALAEDLGEDGDVTTAATVSPAASGTADVVARADGVLAGSAVLDEVFAQVDPRVEVRRLVDDGERVVRDQVVATVHGRLRSLLTGERVALNLLCHLSGVATQTRRFVDAVEGTGVAVRDTRKTTPGLRLLEKAAVAAGGGANHRVGLFDALLVKDNHVLAAGSAGAAARRAVDGAEGRHVQVEVADLDDLDEVLRAGVTDILLDNFSPDQIRMAVRRVAGRASLEASGNVTLATVRAYAETGVDRISTGALTHSAPWLDLAMDVHDVQGLQGSSPWADVDGA